MRNKILLVVILILLPIAIFYNKSEVMEQVVPPQEKIEQQEEEIKVYLNKDNEELELTLDNYLIGVVGSEMPASFSLEALKAQSIVSRSFALSKMKDNKVYTKLSEQSYSTNEELENKWQKDYEMYYNKVKEAVDSTKNLVLTYDNKIIRSYYFSMSNGKTSSSLPVFNEELPYLVSVDSSFDEQNKNFEVTKEYKKEEFCTLLSLSSCQEINISNINKDDSNRIVSLTINNKEYKGTDIRKLLSLRSTDFEITVSPTLITIKTKGYGHGVGMSQYGASYLANQGYNYEEILKYYYKNVEIAKYNV